MGVYAKSDAIQSRGDLGADTEFIRGARGIRPDDDCAPRINSS